MNRLANSSSPYLLQHKENPVAWWEWGPDAFASARHLNRPVLLSIGYAACHWCHVMAHESFEDPDVAAVMNELFVNIKVDREERPDVDHVYMSALQRLGEAGGWPLTMFLTPGGDPFWGGTYFPKEPRFGRPGFLEVLREVARVFAHEPERIAHNQTLLRESLAKGAQAQPQQGGSLDLADLDRIGQALTGAIDPQNGGLGGAPKFPNPAILEFLLRYAHRARNEAARHGFLLSLERMALGGIHDQIGGGFARYSVDERWHVPHFEKMLYDNAQLLELYAVAAHETGRALFRSAAEGIADWLEREMVTPDGAFASSLDADSEGEEGRFYVWALREIEEVLGPDSALFARIYDVSEAGNWEHTNVLNRLLSGESAGEVEERLAPMRKRLLARRADRIRPGLDDKVLADWNGLMIAALVRAGLIVGRADWITLAERAYAFVGTTMVRDGRLGHSYRAGSLVYPGFALDHAAMMRAALCLFEATARERYLDDAQRWRDVLMRDFLIAETGILAMTAKDADRLLVRPQPTHDDAVPNANGVFAEALVRLAQVTGAPDDRALAESALTNLLGVARSEPVAHTSILNALDLYLRGLTIVVGGEGSEPLRDAALTLPYLERTVCLVAGARRLDDSHPAHAAMRAGEGAEALICSGMRCSLPVTTPSALLRRAQDMLNSDEDAKMAGHGPGQL
jgi:uncharacterized protein YyaL (SSP411 family)